MWSSHWLSHERGLCCSVVPNHVVRWHASNVHVVTLSNRGSVMQPRWNIYLVNRGEPPLLYFERSTAAELDRDVTCSLGKMLDGSDADGVLVTRSDYPVPSNWPGVR